MLIDGLQVSALVDTGADYSIISGKLATVLKKVMTLGMERAFAQLEVTLLFRWAAVLQELKFVRRRL